MMSKIHQIRQYSPIKILQLEALFTMVVMQLAVHGTNMDKEYFSWQKNASNGFA